MRLWHQDLINKLDTSRLLGQHRECCALRGLGWGRKHSTVDYVFTYSPSRLYYYHIAVIAEMLRRGYTVDKKWLVPTYRGRRAEPFTLEEFSPFDNFNLDKIYPEHNDSYLQECLLNLSEKGVTIELDN